MATILTVERFAHRDVKKLCLIELVQDTSGISPTVKSSQVGVVLVGPLNLEE